MPGMKRLLLLPVAFLGVPRACSNQPTKEESLRVFASANTALSSAQASAVTQARHTALTASDDLSLNYTGLALSAARHRSTARTRAAARRSRRIRSHTSFASCARPTGTLDGDLHWTSVADRGFAASMNGELDWTSGNDSASCSFDLPLASARPPSRTAARSAVTT